MAALTLLIKIKVIMADAVEADVTTCSKLDSIRQAADYDFLCAGE